MSDAHQQHKEAVAALHRERASRSISREEFEQRRDALIASAPEPEDYSFEAMASAYREAERDELEELNAALTAAQARCERLANAVDKVRDLRGRIRPDCEVAPWVAEAIDRILAALE
jgi:hypothetical protein